MADTVLQPSESLRFDNPASFPLHLRNHEKAIDEIKKEISLTKKKAEHALDIAEKTHDEVFTEVRLLKKDVCSNTKDIEETERKLNILKDEISGVASEDTVKSFIELFSEQRKADAIAKDLEEKAKSRRFMLIGAIVTGVFGVIVAYMNISNNNSMAKIDSLIETVQQMTDK